MGAQNNLAAAVAALSSILGSPMVHGLVLGTILHTNWGSLVPQELRHADGDNWVGF